MTPREIDGLLRMVVHDCPGEHGLPHESCAEGCARFGRCEQCWLDAWQALHADRVDEAAKRITEEAGK